VIQLEKLNGISMQYLDLDPASQLKDEEIEDEEGASDYENSYDDYETSSKKSKLSVDYLKSDIDDIIDHFH